MNTISTGAAPPNDGLRLIPEAELAKLLSISPRAMRDLRTRGEGPPVVKLNARHYVYRPADILAWTEERRSAPERADDFQALGTGRVA